MRIQVDCKILATLIGGLIGLSQGMIYEPFGTCRETAQVDSIQEWVWGDSMETAPPPYRSLYTVAYHPGTCIPAKDMYDAYWMDKPATGLCTLRPGTRINDCVTIMDNGTKREVTTYYTASGKVDSTLINETPQDVDKYPKVTTLIRYLAKPGYDLIRMQLRDGNGPWTQILQDSIVPNGTGKIIYTKGEVNTVTTCVADGKTYACTPVGTSSSGELRKQVWHLTGERVDSLRHFNLNDVHIETEKWSWSNRSTTRTVRQARVSSPWMANTGTAFDVAGRKFPEPDRTQRRFIMVGARKN